jgi:hypothetical protein
LGRREILPDLGRYEKHEQRPRREQDVRARVNDSSPNDVDNIPIRENRVMFAISAKPRIGVRKEYVQIKKTAQWYQIDRRLDLMINLQLSALIPVVDLRSKQDQFDRRASQILGFVHGGQVRQTGHAHSSY